EKRGYTLLGGGEKSVPRGVGLNLYAHLPGRLQHLGLEKDVVHQSDHPGHACPSNLGVPRPQVADKRSNRREQFHFQSGARLRYKVVLDRRRCIRLPDARWKRMTSWAETRSIWPRLSNARPSLANRLCLPTAMRSAPS